MKIYSHRYIYLSSIGLCFGIYCILNVVSGSKKESTEAVLEPLEAISIPSKVKQLPSGLEVPCYNSEYWKKLISSYSNRESYKHCINYMKEEVDIMRKRLEAFSCVFDKTVEDLKLIQCKCENDIPKLKNLLALTKNTYQACAKKVDIDVNSDSISEKLGTEIYNRITEVKEFQKIIQELRIRISAMLNEYRIIVKNHKNSNHPNHTKVENSRTVKIDLTTPETSKTEKVDLTNLESSKIIKIDLITLESSALDLLDVSDNAIINAVNLIYALHELDAEERYSGDVKKRKGEYSIYSNT
jgi:hypothetical protein